MFFFFKQKTAYEMRISDWSSDVCSSDLHGLNTLIDFRYTQHFRASRGKGGAGSNRTGAGGADLVIKAPVGTQILSADKEHVLLAFTRAAQREVFLAGGDGCRGNIVSAPCRERVCTSV